MKLSRAALFIVAPVVSGLIAVGCNKNPITPLADFNSSDVNPVVINAAVGGPVQYSAQVATVDQSRRMFTFKGQPDTVYANASCEVTRQQNGIETTAQFGDIKKGDSVQVSGVRDRDRTVLAYRLRICSDTSGGNMVAGRIRTTNQNQFMFTLAGKPDTIIAGQNCQMFCVKNGVTDPMLFWQLKFGDSVEVTGQRHQNGYVYATKVKLCSDRGQCQYDIAFRDTIVAIDYAAGTITVKNRTETILVDSATFIWGVISRLHETPTDSTQRQVKGCATSGGANYAVSHKDTLLTLTDLSVGDVIEVRAKTIDATTLLAVHLTLAACNDIEKKCVEFTARLASIDSEARLVTFEGLSWVGTVCPGAELLGLDGQPLVLSDFAVAEYVSVKGFPLEDGTLKISEMNKTTP